MKEIDVSELKKKIENKEDVFILDIREIFERDEFHIDSEYIPMAEVPDQIEKIPKNKPVVIYCRSGSRSSNLIQFLERQYDFENLINLKGGINAWIEESNKE